ncbi:MAG TPA: PEP-CTERM sorting domain-containing protein [Lacipirellulaceae bacterium]|nr:PEP-CTERM sorting domain-containing protein [Lacipirellulaceae bacterium]
MRVLSFSFVILLLGTLAVPTVHAQPGPTPIVTIWDLGTPPGSGTGNWNVATNWSRDIVPDVTQEDAAIINGGGTAQINTAIGPNVGSVVLGQGTAAGESGTLEIQSGGTLNVVDDPTFPADGSVRVGQNAGQGLNAALSAANPNAGTGTLRVLPGGTLNSVTLTLGGTVNSQIVLGSTGPGTATVNTSGVTLGRTMRVIGPNVNFMSSGTGAGITFQGTSVFIPEITGATHSVLKTTGTASLGGTLQVDFNGVTPTQGPSWNIIDAASVAGAFATFLPDPGAPLGLGQVIATRTVNGGVNGKLVQMYVRQLPVLSVNRDTGVISITNPGNAGIGIDAYTVQSNFGSLSVANWQSLEDNPGVAGTGWFEGNPSANRLTEVRSGGVSTLAPSGSWGLGSAFRPTFTQFGQSGEDLVFQFNDPVAQETVNGVVNYTGSGTINNLVLFADPATGNVKIRNTSPFTVQIDGYTISSAAGSLNSNPALWTSLQDQPGVAPNWFEGFLTDNRVTEVMSSGTTTLTGNGVTTFDLGGLFKTAGARDLVFQFLLAGNSLPNTGFVLYEAAPSGGGLPGDYNNDGKVDAADYVVWRKRDGSQAGYNTWRTNFGRTAGSGSAISGTAVPEPGTFVLLAAALVGAALGRRK